MKKLCIFTGTRAEYGLLKPIINEFAQSSEVETSILVTGTHLSNAFGNTIKEIEDDGFGNITQIKI